MSTPSSSSSSSGRRPLRLAALLGLVGLGLAATATVAVAGDHGWSGHGCGSHDAENADELRDHAGRVADRVLRRVDASDDQRAAVEEILDDLAPTAFSLKEEGRALRGEARAAVADGDVDAEALEQLRQAALDLADRGSALALGGFVDLADVLDEDQRADLAQQVERWRRR